MCMHISHTGGIMVSENEDIGNECSVCMDNKKNLFFFRALTFVSAKSVPVRLLFTFT